MSRRRNCVVSSRTVMLKRDDSFLSLIDVGGASVPGGTAATVAKDTTRYGTSRSSERCDVMRHDAMLCGWHARQSDGVTLLVVKARACMALRGRHGVDWHHRSLKQLRP